MKSKQYLYNIFHIHSSQFLILMAQKSEEIMPDPDAIIRLRRDRLLGANLTGCDVNFCWMIQIQKKCRQSVLPRSPRPWTLDQLQNPLFLSCFYAECPQGRPCLGFRRVSFFTRDALKGHTVSKNGSISFFSSSYPQIGTLIYSLNSPLSYSGCIVLIVFNKSRPIKIHSCRLYCEGGDPLTPTCVTSKHHLRWPNTVCARFTDTVTDAIKRAQGL